MLKIRKRIINSENKISVKTELSLSNFEKEEGEEEDLIPLLPLTDFLHVGTSQSRSGKYQRPSTFQACLNNLNSRYFCTTLLCVLIFSGSIKIVQKAHPSFRDFESELNISKTNHKCLVKDDDTCTCTNPLDPLERLDIDWIAAFNRNKELVKNITEKSRWSLGGDSQSAPTELSVVFLGDSITEQWNGQRLGKKVDELDSIKNEFERLFNNKEEIRGLALGISGDTTPNLLWRLKNGELTEYIKPKVWWITIGTNDLGSTHCSEEYVIIGIIRVVEEILARKPEATVVINGILPRGDYDGGRLVDPESDQMRLDEPLEEINLWRSIILVNQELEIFANKTSRVKYFDAKNYFLVPMKNKYYASKEHQMIKKLMSDYFHPTAKGHKVWGEHILKFLRENITYT